MGVNNYKYDLWVDVYFRLKCNLYCSMSLPLHVSAVYGHHQVHVYFAKIVPLYVKLHIACERNVDY
jgi:hypothetical protein